MQLVTLDFETYYDREYSLSKMTTEAYVRDPRFWVHGVGVKVGVDDPPVYVHKTTDIQKLFGSLDWDKVWLLCHNTMFDAFILHHWFNIHPRFLLDTMLIGRALEPHESHSLNSMAKRYLGREKGKELESFLGVKRLCEEQQEVMGRYCKNDIDLTFDLFQKIKVGFPTDELRIIDTTLKMFTEPTLILDSELLQDHLDHVENRRENLLANLPCDIKTLRSNPQFAEILKSHGVVPPTKISPTTKKETYAFAKTDEGMMALLDHEDEVVQALVAARLGVKTSIEQTRSIGFIEIAKRGTLPIPLSYCGARNTLRWAGADKVNLQNLPRKGALRRAIMAPPGKKLIVVDLAAIEARMLAWLAQQLDLLLLFRSGADVYCDFASSIYGRPINKKEHPDERFLGKVCILGLGYSMSWPKLAAMLAAGPLGQPPILFGMEDFEMMHVPYIPDADTFRELAVKTTGKLHGEALLVHCACAKHLVDTYRTRFDQIPIYWKTCNRILRDMCNGIDRQYGPVVTSEHRLWMPNGLSLHYRNLRLNDADDESGYIYDGFRKINYIYGAKLTENIDQGLSRVVLADQMNRVSARYKIVLTVHDELVVLADEDDDACLPWVIDQMRIGPDWCADLPLDAEGHEVLRYGDAK